MQNRESLTTLFRTISIASTVTHDDVSKKRGQCDRRRISANPQGWKNFTNSMTESHNSSKQTVLVGESIRPLMDGAFCRRREKNRVGCIQIWFIR